MLEGILRGQLRSTSVWTSWRGRSIRRGEELGEGEERRGVGLVYEYLCCVYVYMG